MRRDRHENGQSDGGLRLAASVFKNAREAIVITSAKGAILDVNDSFTQITGYTREEVLGHNPNILQSGRHGDEFYRIMWRSLKETGHWAGEIWNRHKSGRIYPEFLAISAVSDARGNVRHYVGLFFDISALKEHEEKLQHLALHDQLTGFPNRVFLADRMNQAMVQSRRRRDLVGVVYLDLDSFKSVNDRHGHDVGDQLLVTVSKRMKHVLRESDTLARLGGDEFVIVLMDLANAEAGLPVLNRLLEGVSQPAQIGEYTVKVSASIGITLFPQPGEVDADQLLRQADHAMYRAKLSGGNRFCFFDPDVDDRIIEHEDAASATSDGPGL